MLGIVLGALAGGGPDLRRKVEFGPSHPGDLIAPLACQDQEPDDCAKLGADAVAGLPQGLELVIAEHTIARLLDAGGRQVRDGRRFEDAPLNAPSEKAPD